MIVELRIILRRYASKLSSFTCAGPILCKRDGSIQKRSDLSRHCRHQFSASPSLTVFIFAVVGIQGADALAERLAKMHNLSNVLSKRAGDM